MPRSSHRPPLLLLLLGILGSAFPIIAAEAALPALRLGYYDAKPSCFRDPSGKPAGIFIDVIEAMARREGWSLEYSFETWDQLLDDLRAGRIDLVPAIVDTSDREVFAAFTRESVMTDWGTVFARQGEGLSSMLDLEGRKVGALARDFWFSGKGSLKELCSSFGVHPEYQYFPDYPSLFTALGKGEIAAAVGSNSLGIVWAPGTPVVATSIVFNPIELRFAASLASGDGAALAARLDLALASIRKESPGVFSSALAKYQMPLPREPRIPAWLSPLLATASLVLVLVVLLLVLQRRAIRTSERRLWSFFEDSPISLWEEDFSAVKQFFDGARASGVADWAAWLAPPERIVKVASLVRILDVNRATLGMLGYSRKSEMLTSLSTVVSQEGLDTLRPEFIALAQGQGSYEGESLHRNALGKVLEVQFRLSIMPGYEETWSRVLVSLLDITERKKAEAALVSSLAEKELLLREIHHRVKNNLQIICSLINLQLNEGDPSSAAGRSLVDMEARVRAMSLVHEILYQFDEAGLVAFPSYVGRLCDYLVEAYGIDQDQVSLLVSVDDLRLPLEKAISCGLLINELVVNALKHAFPAGRKGTVRVTMTRSGPGMVSLIVADDGVGFAGPAREETGRRSIGLLLVKSLSAQLGGESLTENGAGMTVRVAFPA